MYKEPYIVLKGKLYQLENGDECRVKFDSDSDDLIGVYRTQKEANKAYSSFDKKDLNRDETIMILAADSGTDWPHNDGTFATAYYIDPDSHRNLADSWLYAWDKRKEEEYEFTPYQFQNLIFVRSYGRRAFAGSHANWRRNGVGHLTREMWPIRKKAG